MHKTIMKQKCKGSEKQTEMRTTAYRRSERAKALMSLDWINALSKQYSPENSKRHRIYTICFKYNLNVTGHAKTWEM